jgi:hypothetical protein
LQGLSEGGREAAFSLQPICNPRVHAGSRKGAKTASFAPRP